MHGLVRLGLVSALFLQGCAPSLKTQAERAFAERRFVDSVALYERAAKKEPELRDGLEAFKQRALTGLINDARGARIANKMERTEALVVLIDDKRELWGSEMSKESGRHFTALSDWVVANAERDVSEILAADAVLAAEREYKRRLGVWNLRDGEGPGRRLAATIADAGQSRCGALQRKDSGALLRAMVVDYCAHFGISLASPPVPRMMSGALAMKATLEGLDEDQVAQVRGALNDAWRTTPWFHPEARRRARATAAGHVTVDRSKHRRHRVHHYTESVPYEDTETYTHWESESYLDNETYTESVPRTSYDTESYSCGTFDSPQMCTRTVPVTTYDLETRTRLVTKYRNVPTLRTRVVTRYRQEDRQHRYPVVVHRARYGSELAVTVKPLRASVVAEARDARSEKDDAHNESVFGLEPRAASLTSDGQWLSERTAALVDELRRAATDSWESEYCQAERFTAKQAARCAHGVQEPPTAVRQTLESLFGDSLDDLRGLPGKADA